MRTVTVTPNGGGTPAEPARLAMSRDELLALDVTVPLATAARAFGMSSAKASELIRAGKFPCPVLELGGRRVVTRSALLEALGVREVSESEPVAPPSAAPASGYAILAVPVSDQMMRELMDWIAGGQSGHPATVPPPRAARSEERPPPSDDNR